jgi:hypothetical protein
MKLILYQLICWKISVIILLLNIKGHRVWGLKNKCHIISLISLGASFFLIALIGFNVIQPIALNLWEKTIQYMFVNTFTYIQTAWFCEISLFFPGRILFGTWRYIISEFCQNLWSKCNIGSCFCLLCSKKVQLVWLSKYSPKFNPVELYWCF